MRSAAALAASLLLLIMAACGIKSAPVHPGGLWGDAPGRSAPSSPAGASTAAPLPAGR